MWDCSARVEPAPPHDGCSRCRWLARFGKGTSLPLSPLWQSAPPPGKYFFALPQHVFTSAFSPAAQPRELWPWAGSDSRDSCWCSPTAGSSTSAARRNAPVISPIFYLLTLKEVPPSISKKFRATGFFQPSLPKSTPPLAGASEVLFTQPVAVLWRIAKSPHQGLRESF